MTTKEMIMNDDVFMYRSLVTLYGYQTADEQKYRIAYHTNNRGFNALDADFLSSLAEAFLKYGYLTEAQMKYGRSKMTKYAGQIDAIMAERELDEVVVKERPVYTPSAIKVTIKVGKPKKCYDEYSVFVSFNYDAKIVSILKAYPERWYSADTHEWELPSKYLDDLKAKLADYSVEIIGEDLLHVEEKTPVKSTEIPSNYEFKTVPFAHQQTAIEFGLKHDKWLLGDTMGLGKTKTAIDIACIKKMENGYKHCLIVCGVNSLKWNWVNEIHTHSNEDVWVLGQINKNGKLQVMGNKEKLDDLKHLEEITEYFIVTNIETLRNQECLTEMLKLTKNKEINMIVLDEAHMCKNPASQQGKALLKLNAETMIAMTGTPLMNAPVDLYTILKWLGYERHSFYSFKNHYCIMGGFGGYEVLGYKNLDQLRSQLDKIMLRRLKEDVFDLPDKIYVDEFVEMSAKQRMIYNEVRDIVKANIDKIITSPNPLAELIRLRQATGYTGILSSEIKESAKIDRLVELLSEAKSNGQKVVIFSNWTQMTDPIKARLDEAGFNGLIITGDTKDSIRQEYVNRFQTDDTIDYIVGTIGAMGTGLTLTAGTIEVFMDEPWNKALKEQAVDRCHRIGTTHNVTIYTLLAQNTIDERIHDIVEKKGMMADAIVDGKIAMDRKELLSYLLD